jgi:hypothetical protein
MDTVQSTKYSQVYSGYSLKDRDLGTKVSFIKGVDCISEKIMIDVMSWALTLEVHNDDAVT